MTENENELKWWLGCLEDLEAIRDRANESIRTANMKVGMMRADEREEGLRWWVEELQKQEALKSETSQSIKTARGKIKLYSQ